MSAISTTGTGSKSDFRVKLMATEEEARRISAFFLSEWSFDDQRHTPGEIEHFRNAPSDSLRQRHHLYWYVEDESGEIVGVTSCKENEHRTDGYLWDYMVVHRQYRQSGVAGQLFRALESYIVSIGGRYLLTYTCDLPEYLPIRTMFERRGFEQIGRYPNFYYEGEDRLAYYKKLGEPARREGTNASPHSPGADQTDRT
ncbi:GNAT family N-acetyltransferase [Paenibacillus hodogayensis]|uniref:GNAT family N-acetyltransferase n=1 Tax=Paenibacillus hodogayensis TaxID=279208 RepID=A0ABV5W5D1_9BACL